MTRRVYFFLLLLQLHTVASSCSKAGEDTEPEKEQEYVYDFTYSGDATAGNTLSFTSSEPADREIKWVFGTFTGDTLYGKVVDYTYNSNGKYSVKMIIDGDTTNIVDKIIEIGLPDFSAFLKKMHWVGKRIINAQPGFQQIDTFLTPVLVNDSVLRFYGEDIKFERAFQNTEYRFEWPVSGDNYHLRFTYYIAEDSCYFHRIYYQQGYVSNGVILNTIK